RVTLTCKRVFAVERCSPQSRKYHVLFTLFTKSGHSLPFTSYAGYAESKFDLSTPSLRCIQIQAAGHDHCEG
ncbi:hypothetical protein BaRGS_00031187, partial [Batillaria attramentaria]